MSAKATTDGGALRRFSTNGSIPEEPDHKQDWTKTTDEKDSWANREKRRNSQWSKLDLPQPSSPREARRGSILSMWAGGKDKNGRDILVHDDHDELESVSSKSDGPASPKMNPRDARRGSILSMWKGGKDENVKDIMGHDDEEWAR